VIPRTRMQAEVDSASDTAELFVDGAGAGSLDVPCVSCGDSFDEDDPAFLFGDGVVQCAAGDDAEVAGGEFDVGLVLDLDTHAAFEYLEELVLVVVFVPHELTDQLGDFDVLIVDLADDFGRPVVGEFGGGIEEIDGGDHWIPTGEGLRAEGLRGGGHRGGVPPVVGRRREAWHCRGGRCRN